MVVFFVPVWLYNGLESRKAAKLAICNAWRDEKGVILDSLMMDILRSGTAMRTGKASVNSCYWTGGAIWTDGAVKDVGFIQKILFLDIEARGQLVFEDSSLDLRENWPFFWLNLIKWFVVKGVAAEFLGSKPRAFGWREGFYVHLQSFRPLLLIPIII